MTDVASAALRDPPLAAPRVWPLAGALLALAIGFWPTLASFPPTWRDGRTHGFAVAACCSWLLVRELRALAPDHRWRWPAAGAAVLLSLLWLAAVVTGVRVAHQLLVPLLLTTWAVGVFGVAGGRRVGGVAAMFALALPVWEVFLPPLQYLTVAVNRAAMQLAGIAASIDGHRIHFPFGTIEVAQSCAGLSYAMSAFTIAVIYARLFLGHTRLRVAAVAFALLLALIGNWIRVFGLVLVGYHTRLQSPLMHEHALYGWVIFAVVMGVFFAFVPRLERADSMHPLRAPMNPRASATTTAAATVTTPATTTATTSRSMAALTAALLVGPLVFGVRALTTTESAASALPSGLHASAEWTMRATGADGGWQPAFRGESERRRLVLVRGDRVVQVDRFVYAHQVQGRELIGGDNRIADDLLASRVVGPLDERLRLVQEAVVRTAGGPRLVWYWYRVADVETPSTMRAKLLELIAFFRPTSASELVAVSTPCAARNCEQATQALYDVVAGRAAAAAEPAP